MKRLIYGILILIALLVGGVYILIPQKLKISSATTYNATDQGVFRFLTTDTNWKKWWPGEINSANSSTVYSYDGFDYTIGKIRYHSFELNLFQNKESFPGLLKVISIKNDTVGIEIDTEIITGNDPFRKIKNYFKAKKIKSSFDGVIAALKNNTDSELEMYGYNIRNEKVRMQFLLSTSKIFPNYPTTENIYSLVNSIREHIRKTDGQEEFSPMLNIETSDSINYFVRIGIPVNKNVPGTKDISVKQMLKNGNILVTEVRGDNKKINEALKQIEKYITDHQRSIIAIPFQSLETDRTKEPDSSKWVTKIYYPVV